MQSLKKPEGVTAVPPGQLATPDAGAVLVAGAGDAVLVSPAGGSGALALESGMDMPAFYGALPIRSVRADNTVYESVLVNGAFGIHERAFNGGAFSGITTVSMFSNITDVTLVGTSTSLVVAVNNAARSLAFLDYQNAGNGNEGLVTVGTLRSALFPAGVSPVSAIAEGDLVLVATENTQGGAGTLLLMNRSGAAATVVGVLGESPRRIRRERTSGIFVVSNFLSDTLTLGRWRPPADPTLMGTVSVADGPVGVDLMARGAELLVVNTGFGDDSVDMHRLDPLTGTVTSSKRTNVSALVPSAPCVDPGHAVFLPNAGPSVVVSCNGSDNVIILPVSALE